MLKSFFVITIIFIGALLSFVWSAGRFSLNDPGGAPPNGLPKEDVPGDILGIFDDWVRPDVPPKVGIQVGHWKNDEVPEELEKLRKNTGARGGGKWEWEVNYALAELISEYLQEKGIQVDILPTTIPQSYWSDVFIALHADGSGDLYKSGYKFAGPWRDFSGDSHELADKLNEVYGQKTGMEFDPNITKNMRGYYAFSWWRFKHAIHPMTTAVIAETGFLTNASDRKIIVENPQIPAEAISQVIIQYLEGKNII